MSLLLLAAFLTVSQGKAQMQIGNDIGGYAKSPLQEQRVTMSADGNVIAYSEPYSTQEGIVRVFKNENGSWTQIGNGIEGVNEGDYAGRSIALNADGSIVAIGDPRYNNETGQVRIYKNENGNWKQIGDKIYGKVSNYRQFAGWSVSLSAEGNTVAIGALHQGQGNAMARVYRNDNGNWIQVGSEVRGRPGTEFATWSVSLSADGSVLAVGAYGKNRVSVYRNENDEWTQIGSDLDGGEVEDYEYFQGQILSLSADGNAIALSSPDSDNKRGHVRIYRNENDAWKQVGASIEGAADDDQFGHHVSLNANGGVVAIGAPNHDGYKGQVRIYKEQNGTWVQVLADIDGVEDDELLGSSLSLSADGSVVAIAAPFYNDLQGRVRVFQLPQQATDFEPLTVSGFNQDLIAEGTGGDATAVTTVPFDSDADGANHVFYTKEYRYGTETGTDGLPNNGVINSETNPGITYQMAAYDGNNALMLEDGKSGELRFAIPQAFNKLAILTASAYGDSKLSVSIHYSDETIAEGSLEVEDWFLGGNIAAKGLGRVKRTTAGDEYENDVDNPKLHDDLLLVNSDKLITKLTFTKGTSGSYAGIFAICGLTTPGVLNAPAAHQATEVVKNTSFTANWAAVNNAAGYRLDVAKDPDFTEFLTGYNNLDVQNATSYTVATTEDLVYYRVRAYNFFGQTLSSNNAVVDVALGVEMPQLANINLYPNPANSQLNVSSGSGAIESLIIRDIAGKVVFQSNTAFENTSLNISNWKPGMYHISFSNKGQQTTTKFMKL